MMKMSYTYKAIIGLVVVMLLSCCVKVEPAVRSEDSGEIYFNSPVMSAAAKAVSGVIDTYPESEKFKVYAKYSSGDFVSWSSDITYIDGVEAAYDSSENGWTTSMGASGQAYYWPNSGNLTFAAYSPSDCPGASYGNAGLVVNDFVVSENATERYELLYAPRAMNKTSSSVTSGLYDGVQLNFRHALSCIDFRVRNAANYSGSMIYIKSVKILNAYSEGDFAENIIDGSTYEASPDWTGQKTEKEYTFYNSLTGPGHLVTVETLPLDVEDLLMIPQELDHTSRHIVIRLEYDDNGVDKISDIDLVNGFEGGYFNDGTNEIREWEPGKKYTYTITFGKYKIFFTPSVDDSNWSDSGRPPVYI